MNLAPRHTLLLAAITMLCATSLAQQTPPPGSHSHSPNIELILQTRIDLAAGQYPLARLVATLARADPNGINIVVNWPALAAAGITRDTPITLRLHDVSLEDALRATLLGASTEQNVLNYVVSPGVIEITTNAEIDKLAETRFIDLTAPLNAPPGTPIKDANPDADRSLLQQYLHSQLLRIGERIDDPGKAFAVQKAILAVTTSPRGLGAVQHALDILSRPTRPGQFAPGTPLSVAARKATEAFNALLKQKTDTDPLVELARHADEKSAPNANLNLLILPGTRDELQTAKPALACFIDPAGILHIGPAAATHPPTLLAVYDLREILAHRAFRAGRKPPYIEALTPDLLSTLKSKVPSATWGNSIAAETSATPYHGMLIVFAPASTQREVSLALQEMNK